MVDLGRFGAQLARSKASEATHWQKAAADTSCKPRLGGCRYSYSGETEREEVDIILPGSLRSGYPGGVDVAADCEQVERTVESDDGIDTARRCPFCAF